MKIMKNILYLIGLMIISSQIFAQATTGHSQALAATALSFTDNSSGTLTMDVIKREEDAKGKQDVGLNQKTIFYKNHLVTGFAANDDGSRSLILDDGSQVNLSADGNTIKEISADGKTITSKHINDNVVITQKINNDKQTTTIATYNNENVDIKTYVIENNQANNTNNTQTSMTK